MHIGSDVQEPQRLEAELESPGAPASLYEVQPVLHQLGLKSAPTKKETPATNVTPSDSMDEPNVLWKKALRSDGARTELFVWQDVSLGGWRCHQMSKHGGGSIMLRCIAQRGWNKEGLPPISTVCTTISTHQLWLRLRLNWLFQKDNDPKRIG